MDSTGTGAQDQLNMTKLRPGERYVVADVGVDLGPLRTSTCVEHLNPESDSKHNGRVWTPSEVSWFL